MRNKLELNIIWKTKDIFKIDKKNLDGKFVETFYLDEEKSSEDLKVFKDIDANKKFFMLFKKRLLWLALLVVSLFVFAEIKAHEIIGVAFMIATLVAIIRLLSTPFYRYSQISFRNSVNGISNNVLIKNMIGYNSALFGMEFPIKLGRIVFKQSDDKIYVTFRESVGDHIPLGSPILVLDFKNEYQVKATEEFLSNFINKAKHDMVIDKVYADPN